MRQSPNQQAERRRRLGRAGEALARESLIAQGYSIIEANVRYPVGELDLVAMEGKTLCFVEIRSASLVDFGGAAASITWKKQKRLLRAAAWYLRSCRLPFSEVRFDVVAIQWGTPQQHPSLELIRGAFDATGL